MMARKLMYTIKIWGIMCLILFQYIIIFINNCLKLIDSRYSQNMFLHYGKLIKSKTFYGKLMRLTPPISSLYIFQLKLKIRIFVAKFQSVLRRGFENEWGMMGNNFEKKLVLSNKTLSDCIIIFNSRKMINNCPIFYIKIGRETLKRYETLCVDK